jgi:hypothetical protein
MRQGRRPVHVERQFGELPAVARDTLGDRGACPFVEAVQQLFGIIADRAQKPVREIVTFGDRRAKPKHAVAEKLVERPCRIAGEPLRIDSFRDERLHLRFPREAIALVAVEQELSRVEDAGLFDRLLHPEIGRSSETRDAKAKPGRRRIAGWP